MKIEIELTEEDREDIATKVASKLQSIISGSNQTYSVNKVALMLNCHKNTVLNYINKGILKASRKGKRFIITQEAIDEFLDR